jgi:hypothetical protein
LLALDFPGVKRGCAPFAHHAGARLNFGKPLLAACPVEVDVSQADKVHDLAPEEVAAGIEQGRIS